MPSHHEAIARRMIARIAPDPDREEAPSSPTDETTDESATGETAPFGGGDLVLRFAAVVVSVAGQAWATYQSLEPKVFARRQRAAQSGDMPALQRETAHVKQLLVRRLQSEAVTPPDLPESFRARLLDAAAEETLVEIDRSLTPAPAG